MMIADYNKRSNTSKTFDGVSCFASTVKQTADDLVQLRHWVVKVKSISSRHISAAKLPEISMAISSIFFF